jgi:hypothetical protein
MSFRERAVSGRKDSSSSVDSAHSSLPPGLPRPPSAPRTSRPSIRTGREQGLAILRSGSSTPDADSDDNGRDRTVENYSLTEQIEHLKNKLAEERRCRLLAEKLLLAATAGQPRPSIPDTTHNTAAGWRMSDFESSTPRTQNHSPLSNDEGDSRPPTALRCGLLARCNIFSLL